MLHPESKFGAPFTSMLTINQLTCLPDFDIHSASQRVFVFNWMLDIRVC